jgi:hypothetical protein
MSQAPILYQETRIWSTPTLQSQILNINTSGEPSTSLFGAGRKRGYDEYADIDEDSYARKYLATEGSIFFRRKQRAPRTFLWRVLDDRKVLEIQSVDLVHDGLAPRSESCLTFRISVGAEILRNGVAFADPEESDALEVFVLTMQNELYTFVLKRDLLTRDAAPSDFDVKTVFRKYSSSSLSFRQPYRLVAVTSLELLVALGDGRMVRLQRQPNESGAQWKETHYSEGGWTGTLRGMIPGQKQWVKFGDQDLDASTIAAMAKSPDGKYIWTVTLDHVLKAWSTQSAQPSAKQDLLAEKQREEGRRPQKYVMTAEQGTLMQVVVPPSPKKGKSVIKMDEDGGKYYIVVHSPKDHQFKFYEIVSKFSSVEGMDFELHDLHSGVRLIPPIDAFMDTNIWHLEDFFVQPGVDWKGSQIWIRARSGSVCRTFMLTFDIDFKDDGEVLDLGLAWEHEWVEVNTGIRTTDALREYVDFPGELEDFTEDAEGPNERWIDFLFTPGRFSIASTESALHIYSQGRNLQSRRASKGLKPSQEPLKERLVRAITAKIILTRLPNDQPNFVKYHTDVQEQWKMFYSLLSHLHSRRHDSIGFAFDTEDALPWSVCADFVAPVCETSYFDNLLLNNDLLQKEVRENIDAGIYKKVFPDEESGDISRLLVMMRDFHQRLSADFQQRFKDYVTNEALTHDGGDREEGGKRVQAIYDATKVNQTVTDDDFQALEAAAEEVGGLGGVSDDAILAVLELLSENEEGLRKQKRTLLRYGDKFMIAAAQEILEKDQATLLSVLVFVVFLYGDLDREELDQSFVSEIGPIYDAILVRIRHNALLTWLAGHEIPDDDESRTKQTAEVPNINLMERIGIADLDARSRGHEEMPELLTLWSRLWVYGPFTDMNQDWDGSTGHILGFLIKHKQLELATEFQKFLSPAEGTSGWVTYLTGRLLLATGEYALASLKFRAAADDMAEATNIGIADDNFLLSADERNYFGVGHASFYQHILTLYEKLTVWSYTADFAALALRHLKDDFDQARNSKGARQVTHARPTDSPEVKMIDDVTNEIGHHLGLMPIRDELAGRLFNALVQTGRFRGAFDALNEIDNHNVKKANLRELVEKCVKQDAVPDLLALPFEDVNLTPEADAILYAFARKGLASGTAGSPPYYQILYAFRTQRSDFRGAAGILYEQLQRLLQTYHEHGMQDPEDETLLEAYVLLINTLACCGKDDAWLLAEPVEEVQGEGKKRRLVTIDEVRKEYGAELDRRSDVLQGRFALVGGDAMDVF